MRRLLGGLALVAALRLAGAGSAPEQEVRHPATAPQSPQIVVVIPTVPRRRLDLSAEREYLHATLEGLAADREADAVVHVVSHTDEGEDHRAFDEEKELRGKDPRFVFVKRPRTKTCAHAPPDFEARASRGARDPPPSFRVRRQTMDIVDSLEHLQTHIGPDSVVLLMEDDFLLCESFFSRLRGIMRAATERLGSWLSLRVSYGFNGLVLRSAGDVAALARYLEDRCSKRPPDHLLVEFFAGESSESSAHKRARPHLVARANMMRHVGAVSTLRVGLHTAPEWECGREMTPPVVFQVEAFDENACFASVGGGDECDWSVAGSAGLDVCEAA